MHVKVCAAAVVSILLAAYNVTAIQVMKVTHTQRKNTHILTYHYLRERIHPADTDVIKTSSGRLKKVTTPYDQTRRLQDVWQMTSDLRRLEDV